MCFDKFFYRFLLYTVGLFFLLNLPSKATCQSIETDKKLGPAGPDKGQGGKYLVLPSEYEGDMPEGYFVVRSKTYGVWNFMRGYLDKGVKAASDNIRDNLKVYPLSAKNSQPPMEFINVTGKEMNTIVPADYSFYTKLHTLVQEEPVDFMDGETRGVMRSIGIEKGQFVWEDISSGWVVPFAEHDASLKTDDGVRKIEMQMYYHYNCIVVTPVMAKAIGSGKGSEYVFKSFDADEGILYGAKNYEMTLPADVPIADFWAITLYDTQTRSQLQTVPGKSFFVCLRMYGPTEPWIEGKWRPGDVELVK